MTMGHFSRKVLAAISVAILLSNCSVSDSPCSEKNRCVSGYACNKEGKCIPAANLTIANDNLPLSYVDEPYEILLQSSGGIRPYQWTLQSELAWISATEQTAGMWYLSGTPDSPTPLSGTDVTVSVTDDSYGAGSTEQKTLTLVTLECEENERRDCFVPEGGVCMNGSQRCIGDTWEQCIASQGPSTDIEHCGENCEQCDLAKSDRCNNGTCACGNGSPCTGNQICCYGECYDAPECGDCGNEIRDGIEECDKEDYNEETCQTLGYYGGQLKCDENCRYDLIECMIAGKCGDNSRNGPEDCDGTDLADANCVQFSYISGDLGCTNDCIYEYSNCCGDGTNGSTEQCDDANVDPWGGCNDCSINDFILDNTTQAHMYLSIDANASGTHIVVWSGDEPNGQSDVVYGRLLDQQGMPISDSFRIDTSPAGRHESKDVAINTDGRFVVVWDVNGLSGQHREVFGRIYDSSGTPVGDDFQINTFASDDQRNPSVAISPTGDFVVVWSSQYQDGSADGVYGRRYNSLGIPQGDEFLVSTTTESSQQFPDVAMDDLGNFFVVWGSYFQDGSHLGIFGQRFDQEGNRVGNEFQINTFTEDRQGNASISLSPDGHAVVAWESAGQDGSGKGIYAQLFNNDGNPIGSEVQVNTYTLADQHSPSVSVNTIGESIILWTSHGYDGWDEGIAGQRFDQSGTKIGSEFQVNIYIDDQQAFPVVALDPNGNFTAAWLSSPPPDTGFIWTIMGQRYTSQNAPKGRVPY